MLTFSLHVKFPSLIILLHDGYTTTLAVFTSTWVLDCYTDKCTAYRRRESPRDVIMGQHDDHGEDATGGQC